MRSTLLASVVLLATLSAAATAETASAAPQVTRGAQLKYLRFDWQPVAGATSYQLRMKVGNGAYTSVGGPLLGTVTSTRRYIAVHRIMATAVDELSLAEIAKRLGVSRERARQLEGRALKKLARSAAIRRNLRVREWFSD